MEYIEAYGLDFLTFGKAIEALVTADVKPKMVHIEAKDTVFEFLLEPSYNDDGHSIEGAEPVGYQINIGSECVCVADWDDMERYVKQAKKVCRGK